MITLLARRPKNWVLAAMTAAWVTLAACRTGDDSKCEVACHCRDDVQYREAGYCDRDELRCVSGYEVCEQLCRDNGGIQQICSPVSGQPVGHLAPSLACPGDDPHGDDCGPVVDCRVRRGSPPWLVGIIILALTWRRRREGA